MPYAIKSNLLSWRAVEADWSLEPDETLFEEVPESVNLANAKALKQSELDASFNTAQFSGFWSSALGQPHFYASTSDDKANLQGALILAQVTSNEVLFTCTDSEGVKQQKPHSYLQLAQVMVDGGQALQTLLAALYAKKAIVEAASTVEEVEAVTW